MVLVRVPGRSSYHSLFYYSMHWSLPILLFSLPLGGLAGKRKLNARQCKQSSPKSTNTTHNNPTSPTHNSANTTHNPTNPTHNPTSTAHNPTNTTHNPTNPTQKPTNPSQNPTNTTHTYTLQDFYQGNSFLSNDWVFFSQADPTHGNVAYQTKEDAIKKNLAVVQNGVAILSVDDTTTLPVGGMRDSVRITSSKTYNSGLFIADFQKMPTGCSVWPAYWSVGQNWPVNGEIDVVEGVNNQVTNQMTLHTGPGCSMPQVSSSMFKGRQLSTSCPTTQDSNSGCAFSDPNSNSFGTGFNAVNGGVFAHLWNDDGISIWHWPRSSIPNDIAAKNPNPSSWGLPDGLFPSTNCDMASHFISHSLVIDTTLCGDWAGSVYGASGCPGTCADAVANPANFKAAKWEINSIAVYQKA